MHTDLPRTVNGPHDEWSINYHRDLIFGVIISNTTVPSENTGAMSLHAGFVLGRQISPNMLLTVGSTTIAVISQADNNFVIVDSHAWNESGLPDSDGVARMFRFSSLSSLLSYLTRMYQQPPFDITPVTIDQTTCSELTPEITTTKKNNEQDQMEQGINFDVNDELAISQNKSITDHNIYHHSQASGDVLQNNVLI